MKYRITKVNGEDICGIDYATLCEHCGKHFVIASPFEGIHNYCNKCVVDIDMATRTDYVVLESGVALCYSFECVCEHSGKCGSCPIMLGYDEACAHAAYAKLRIIDTEYETMLEEMRKSDYEELADSDLPF